MLAPKDIANNHTHYPLKYTFSNCEKSILNEYYLPSSRMRHRCHIRHFFIFLTSLYKSYGKVGEPQTIVYHNPNGNNHFPIKNHLK